MKSKMGEIGLKLWMYKQYVDDVNTVMTTSRLVLRLDGNKMVENQIAANEDRGLEADERAMQLFQSSKIARR